MAKTDDVTTDDLRDNVVELRKDLKQLMTTVERLALAQAGGVSNKLRDEWRTYADKGEEVLGSAREHAERAYDDLNQSVARNPLAAILIALGLGFLIGMITRSKP